MPGQICPFHSGEWPNSRRNADGSITYTCQLVDHSHGDAYSWLEGAAPPPGVAFEGIAAELGLDLELPAVVVSLGGDWVEYGLVERAYAQRCPVDFTGLVQRYGHRARSPSQYTVSAFLASCLGRLAKAGSISYHDGPATGDWSYNGRISWWAPADSPPWSDRRSWFSEGADFDYVPS